MSLRARLVLGIVVLMAVGLAAADVAGVALLRNYQLQRTDQQVSVPLTNAVGLGSGVNDPASLCRELTAPPGGRPQLPTSFAALVLAPDGTEQCRLPTQPGLDGSPDLGPSSGRSLTAMASSGTNETVPSTVGASSWRVRVVPAGTGFIVIAVSLADSEATAARLARIETVVGLAILLLAAAGGWATVRIGLAPLTAIERTAMTIAGGDLSRRVAGASIRTEVGRLASALNAMLTQIEEAFASRTRSEDRLRQFVADASHELRTPIATIRGHAELYRQGVATSPADVARLLSRIESESVRMGALVEDLLLLARLDASPVLERRPVDVLTVAADAVVDARAQDPGRTIVLRRLLGSEVRGSDSLGSNLLGSDSLGSDSLGSDSLESNSLGSNSLGSNSLGSNSLGSNLRGSDSLGSHSLSQWLDEPPEVQGDEARLRQILANLLSNALRYTPSGSPVEVEVGAQQRRVQLRVVDHGPGIAPGDADRVFERFYRQDPGRSRQYGGAGLGLSIVASLTRAHGGSVRHEPTPGGGATFVVMVPR